MANSILSRQRTTAFDFRKHGSLISFDFSLSKARRAHRIVNHPTIVELRVYINCMELLGSSVSRSINHVRGDKLFNIFFLIIV